MVIGRILRESRDTARRVARRGIESAREIAEPRGSVREAVGTRTRSVIRRTADSAGAEFRRIEKKKAPKTLALVGLVAVILSSFYLVRLFSSLPTLLESDTGDSVQLILSAFVILVVFFQYLYYVTTVFKLASGMRSAWANMVRLSGSYILLLLITETGLLDYLSLNLVVANSWILAAVMVAVIVYMLLPSIREFFLPSYEEDPGLKGWVQMVFWMDPFKDDDAGSDVPEGA